MSSQLVADRRDRWTDGRGAYTPAVIQTDLSEVREEEEAGHRAGEATSAAGAA